MQRIKLNRGLDLPIKGAPEQTISDGQPVRFAAVIGDDYIGLKPRILVSEGDKVGAGDPVLENKEVPDALIVSPVSGTVESINRGHRRKLISVVIKIDEKAAKPVSFSRKGNIKTEEGLVTRLCASGLWNAFRTRPYSKIPDPETRPLAIYVTAMDTEPLSPDASVIISEEKEAFVEGLKAIAGLSQTATFLCSEKGVDVPGADLESVTHAEFSGPHPAGLPGTHMHFLQPPTVQKPVWTIWYQDVIAIGHLLKTGKINSQRVIALSGPMCKSPRLVRTISGASMEELTKGEFDENAPVRLISGSVLSGRAGEGAGAFLGRYDRQITIIENDHEQIPMGWIRPMPSKFAYQPVLGSALSRKLYSLTTNLNGGRRAMVPLGTFEELMPQDFLPTQLLRSLLVMDTDQAQALGALELDEEDLGLVTFACPAKYEYGLALRDCLSKIEKEG